MNMRVASSIFFAGLILVLQSGASLGQANRFISGSSLPPARRSANVPARVARPPIQNSGGRPYSIRNDIPTPIGLNPPAASYTGILPGAYKPQPGGGRSNRGTAGFVGGPLYLPFLGADPSIGNFPSYPETVDPNAQAFAATQDALAEQIRQLSNELEAVKRQGPPPPEQAPVAAPEPSTPQPSVSVILKNGQQISIQSYAVMNGFLWDFSKQPVRKIPLSNIDIPASTKATEANGAEFPQIGSGQP